MKKSLTPDMIRNALAASGAKPLKDVTLPVHPGWLSPPTPANTRRAPLPSPHPVGHGVTAPVRILRPIAQRLIAKDRCLAQETQLPRTQMAFLRRLSMPCSLVAH